MIFAEFKMVYFLKKLNIRQETDLTFTKELKCDYLVAHKTI